MHALKVTPGTWFHITIKFAWYTYLLPYLGKSFMSIWLIKTQILQHCHWKKVKLLLKFWPIFVGSIHFFLTKPLVQITFGWCLSVYESKLYSLINIISTHQLYNLAMYCMSSYVKHLYRFVAKKWFQVINNLNNQQQYSYIKYSSISQFWYHLS